MMGARRKPRRNAYGWLHCPDCDRYLPPEAFGRCASDPLGRDTYCRACRVPRNKASYNRRASDPVWCAERAAAQRAWWRARRGQQTAERLAIVRQADDRLRAAGLLQRERAARLGVHVGTLWLWQRGRVCPEPASVQRALTVIRALAHDDQEAVA